MTRSGAIYRDLIQSLNLVKDENRIKKKAIEISSQMDLKIGSATMLKNWSTCKPIYAIQIACEMLRVQFDRRCLLKSANTTEQDYYSSLSYIKKALGISSLIDFESLASRFGCPKLIPYAENMLEIFKEEWCKELSAASKRGIDWNGDIYKIAVFWCCCKNVGGQDRVSQDQLIGLQDFSTSRTEFQRTVKLVEKYCKTYISELKSQIKKGDLTITFIKSSPSKRKYVNDDYDYETGKERLKKCVVTQEDTDDELLDIIETRNKGSYTETKLYKDYLVWRKEIFGKIEAQLKMMMIDEQD
ncbi:16115_t:CDS:2 [Acaulospora morrowiae]|uniref:16115_t:CDS:1 n=1 Tax=Acaulospora morrowiae TaxID=94023 RepID=A0A9N8ZXZ7_9GLOM|nr:16115_t:CDS:2 [Acaulospora morrowiae]